ncbi:MAG TPA: CHAT domain-containing protein [Thermoanaerobaculia bacterium]|jgi:CHAT domain-containing protein|nr:CHAT domain-containing protein [Thermoanaerobaculia bacterium]
MSTRAEQHLDPETLAAFAEGRLGSTSAAGAVAHLDGCDDCTSDLALAMTAAREERQTKRFGATRWGLAVAAMILLFVVAVPTLRNAIAPRHSGIGRLTALAPASGRLVEPRLTGGFAWAPYAGTERAGGESTNTARMKLTGAAGDLAEDADRTRDADSQHAAGVAMVLVQAPDDAIRRLEAAAAQTNDAKIQSDLAAARYAAAAQLGRASLYPQALAAADAALRADPKLPEALFNRALILERIGLTEEAARAWQRYLDVDPSSPWAVEARARLRELPPPAGSSHFERERPLLEAAAARGDAGAVRRHVDADRDRSRAWAEGEYLGLWGDALQCGDVAAAARWLPVARMIGSALVSLSGESLLADAVDCIDRASEADRAIIAAAHSAYRRGRIAYSRRELDAAQRELTRAAELFASARDPMALSARYYAASVRLARSDTAIAGIELQRVRADADSHPAFLDLGAHIRWELGRVLMVDDDWNGAVDVLREGASMFRRSGDRTSEAFVESLLARALTGIGQEDEAWQARMRAFGALSAEGERGLLATSVDAAMHAELASGRTDAALALSGLELAVARAAARPEAVIDALLTDSMLQSMSGNAIEGLQSARQAEQDAQSLRDSTLRERRLADSAAAAGAALTGSDSAAAAESLTRAIEYYKKNGVTVALPEPLLLRARGAQRRGDTAAALRNLEEGIAVVERHPAGATGRPGVLDAEHALFTDAIGLSLDRGDTAAAFAFAERSRRAAITLAALQRRLAGSGAAVVEIVSLPAEIVVFAVTEHQAAVARHAQTAQTLRTLADESLTESGTTAVASLYDALIRPIEPTLSGARELVIVPDPSLRAVPFAALYDRSSQRHLVERFPLSIAAGASSLERAEPHGHAPSVAAMALGGGTRGLPEAEREIGEVASAYDRKSIVTASAATVDALWNAAASADVLHIAGHTERQPGGGEQALMLGGGGRVSWRMVLASPGVRSRTVVLGACETLRPPASSATQALSLGEAFAVAGARDVVGTLAPIGDRDARLFFRALHGQLARGVRAADALREVQRDAIAANREKGGRQAWRALALLTRDIPAPEAEKETSWPHRSN